MAAKFVVKIASDGRFFFNLVTEEGRKLLGSDYYATKPNVFEGITSIRMNATDASRYRKRVSTDGKAYFTFRAPNQETVFESDMYDNEDLRDQAMSKMLHSGADAPIIEATAPKKSKAEVTKTLEARKLNKRTMRVMPGDAAVTIRFGAVLHSLKEDDRRLMFEYLGDIYEADLIRAKGALRMIE
ncbi:MAG TPA: YegP family protein [Bryobacteraceae bacterium]|jgi:hypothetical protein